MLHNFHTYLSLLVWVPEMTIREPITHFYLSHDTAPQLNETVRTSPTSGMHARVIACILHVKLKASCKFLFFFFYGNQQILYSSRCTAQKQDKTNSRPQRVHDTMSIRPLLGINRRLRLLLDETRATCSPSQLMLLSATHFSKMGRPYII